MKVTQVKVTEKQKLTKKYIEFIWRTYFKKYIT